MSLGRMAMKMAIGFAAFKGYKAFRQGGGLDGVKRMLAGGGGSAGSGGGIGGLLGSLGGSAGGGLSGSGGLLGGLAAMAGGSAALGGGRDAAMKHAEAGPADDATAAVMIRAIGQAVRADGQIDAAERAILDDMMDSSETAEDRAALDAALGEAINPEKLARDVPRGGEAQVYAAALTAIDPDRTQERDFLKRFATALALETPEVERLHEAAGKPV